MSNINPNNINGTFPVAGQDNDSQGFRDNFTNILNNFSFTKAELEDLQSKAVLKSALNGTTLNNSLAFNEVSNLKIRSYALSAYDYTNIQTPSVAIDFSLGNFFHFTTTQSASLALTNWPNTGYAAVRVWIGIANTAHTIQFPAAVSINVESIAGWDAGTRTITFAETGNFMFEIASYDGGASYMMRDLIRAKRTISGNLHVSGNVNCNASSYIGGNLFVTGNLTVQGNTTQINVETITVEDPLIDLGGGAGGSALINNDAKDRGMLMRYYNAGAINAFMGWDNSAAEFVLGSNVSVTSDVITVNTLGNIRANIGNFANIFVGNVTASSNLNANNVSITNSANVANLIVGNVTNTTSLNSPLATIYQVNSTTANVGTLAALNVSAGNARISGGYADNFPVGANTAAPGAFTTLTSSSTSISSGNIVAAATTTSTSTTTGALVVRGGAGIAGNVNIGGNLVIGSGIINTDFREFTVINDQNFFANVEYNTFVIDTDTSLTISNLWITLPETAINGRTLSFTMLAPVNTDLIFRTSTPGSVKWVANTIAQYGNVSVQLTYSTTSNKWIRTG
jgi:hypothetical protein